MKLADSIGYYRGRHSEPRETSAHLQAAFDWLLLAQEKGKGGFAHSYSLREGWLPPYSETTGYLIPTLLQLNRHLNDDRITASALTAGRWLVGVQNSDGSYDSLSKNPMVFNTGQIVHGLVALYRHTNDTQFLKTALKSGQWILDQQDPDGSWIRNSYRNIRHSYYAKVGSALMELAEASGKNEFQQAGEKNVQWTLGQQLPNGFFKHAAFSAAEDPFLHTIVYVAEGLLAVDARQPHPAARGALKKWGEALLAAADRDFPLYSRYGEDWQPALRQICVTGLSQWARVALTLADMFKEARYKVSADKTIQFLKTRQIFSSSSNLHGALPGSIPVWGEYLPYSFINWGQKYFLDALMAQQDVSHG